MNKGGINPLSIRLMMAQVTFLRLSKLIQNRCFLVGKGRIRLVGCNHSLILAPTFFAKEEKQKSFRGKCFCGAKTFSSESVFRKMLYAALVSALTSIPSLDLYKPDSNSIDNY